MPISASFFTYVQTVRIRSVFQLCLCTGSVFAASLPAQSDPAHSAPARPDRKVDQHLLQVDSAASYTPVKFHREIQSAVALASRYFDLALSFHYAYRNAESVRAFREAQRVDPRCVMCAVGEALALGPGVDTPMDSAANAQARSAIRRAHALIERGEGGVSDAAWVRALSVRYSSMPCSSRRGIKVPATCMCM